MPDPSPNEPDVQRELSALRASMQKLERQLHHTQRQNRLVPWLVGLWVLLSLGGGSFAAVQYFGADGTTTNVPSTIAYEGYLEEGGEPVDGERTLVSTLKNDDVPVWTGTQLVTLNRGRFVTQLGGHGDNAATTLEPHELDGGTLTVHIAVEGDDGALISLGGGQAIHSVPFAGKAQRADDFEAHSVYLSGTGVGAALGPCSNDADCDAGQRCSNVAAEDDDEDLQCVTPAAINVAGQWTLSTNSEGGLEFRDASGERQLVLAQGKNFGGTTYTHWGKQSCPADVETVYSGIAMGDAYSHTGGTSSYSCIPVDGVVINNGVQGTDFDATTEQQGSIQQIVAFSTSGYGIEALEDYNGKQLGCAVCYVAGDTTHITVPATQECPSNGWSRQYRGYLMSSSSSSNSSTESICVNHQPDDIPWDTSYSPYAYIYQTELTTAHHVSAELFDAGYLGVQEWSCSVCTR